MAEDAQPSSTSEIQQPLEASQSGQEEGNPDQNPSQALPPPTPAVPDQPPPNGHQQHADKENRNGLNIARFIVEILTLLVLLWYTIVTRGLWKVADQTNRLNIENARLDQRPWVFVTEFTDIVYEVGKFPKFTLKVVNTGRTPGKVVEKSLSLHVAASDMLPQIPQYNELWPTNFFVFPDVAGSMTGVGASLVTQDLWDRIRREHLSIFVCGYIKYESMFGEIYWTGFILAINSKWVTVENPPYPNYVYAY